MKTILLILFTMLTCGCLSYRAEKHALKYFAKAQYAAGDTILVGNYFLCKSYLRASSWVKVYGEKAEIDADSTWTFFQAALEKQPLPLDFSPTPTAYCDSVWASNVHLRSELIDLDEVRAWGKVIDDSQLRLVPVIHITYEHTSFVTAGGAGWSNTGLLRNVYLTTHAYIFRGQELIYSRGMVHIADTETGIDIGSPVTSIDQSHWDKLLALTLKPYLKQLE